MFAHEYHLGYAFNVLKRLKDHSSIFANFRIKTETETITL